MNPTLRAPSLQAHIDAQIAAFSSANYCLIESEVLNGDFSSYYESGSGRISERTDTSPTQEISTIDWLRGVHRFHSIDQSYKLIFHRPVGNPAVCTYHREVVYRATRGRDVSCPEGTMRGVECYRFKESPKAYTCSDTTSNPCQVSTGAKLRHELDFAGSAISFTRNYHSQNLSDKGFGKGWHNPHFRNVSPITYYSYYLTDGSGRVEKWPQDRQDSKYLVSRNAAGFQVTTSGGGLDLYDPSGRLLESTKASGEKLSYVYDVNDLLIEVNNNYNQGLSFAYNPQNRVKSITNADGVIYRYEYDEKRNLKTVIYPDATPNDDLDNPRKIYHYEDADFPNHLTGITDENGDRYATFEYDEGGKAKGSELGQTTNSVGQEKVELDYQGAN